MKISIVTVCFNSAATISDTIKSVLSQRYKNIEYIIVDGASTDNTLDIVRASSSHIRFCSEPDRGIYDAMNKGIRMATGDVVGILNADDFYINDLILDNVAKTFLEKRVDSLFADLVYVHPDNLSKIVRYYCASNFTPEKFASGWMPPHPTFFVKREIYERYGLFKIDYKIASDFELLARFLNKHRISYHYLPEVLIKMRTGGVSTKNLRSNWILNKEIVRACSENDIQTNLVKVYSKYLTKIFQIVGRPCSLPVQQSL